MRIGILTFHFGINYGGVLQCYALQEYLTQHGHSVKIIHFNPIGNDGQQYSLYRKFEGISKFWIKFLKNILFHPYIFCNGIIQKIQFQKFRSHKLNLTQAYRYDDLKNIVTEFDAIIVGSDQVWNPSQHAHGVYFLAPFVNFRGLRISYSPCCAINKIQEKNKKLLIQCLSTFDSVSVRNMETYLFMKDLTSIEPPMVIDPVMLFGFEKLIDQSYSLCHQYILTYILGSEIEGGHEAVIEKIKMMNGKLPVFSIILTEKTPKIFSWSDRTFRHASVTEWLNLFYNANFVYTDSFHGVLFALKFKKKFLAYYKDNARKSRFIDLIMRYKLDSNIVDSYQSALRKRSFSGMVNYEVVSTLIDKHIEKSKDYLFSSLKK